MAGRRLRSVKVCPRCGEKFSPWRSTQRYCSFACGNQRPEKRAVVKCAFCGAEVEHQLSQAKIQTYCSRVCASRAGREKKRAKMLLLERRGKRNPNFKHGGRAGVRDRAGEERFHSGQLFCQHPGCLGDVLGLNQHHVVYEQHVKDRGGDRWDARNALCLCHACHTSHHRRGTRVVPISALRDENLEFAFDLLGEAALDYLRRYYIEDGGRLKKFASCAVQSPPKEDAP